MKKEKEKEKEKKTIKLYSISRTKISASQLGLIIVL